MATDKLSLATLGDIGNGAARVTIDDQINRAVADTVARGKHDGKKRQVQIIVELELGEDETIIARAFAVFKPPPFFGGASRGEVSEKRGGPAEMLFDLAEADGEAA